MPNSLWASDIVGTARKTARPANVILRVMGMLLSKSFQIGVPPERKWKQLYYRRGTQSDRMASDRIHQTECGQLSAARPKIFSADEGVFPVVLCDGLWKVQARSLMGT
jgi:hypothetical protein